MRRHTQILAGFENSKKIKKIYPINCDEIVPVKCIDAYDGDTVKLAFHLYNDPKNDIVVFPCRLMGIDTPEMKGPEKDKAIIARDFLRNLILGKCIWAKFHTNESEKYGRLLTDIFLDEECSHNVNKMMIDNDFAKPYFGGTK